MVGLLLGDAAADPDPADDADDDDGDCAFFCGDVSSYTLLILVTARVGDATADLGRVPPERLLLPQPPPLAQQQ